MKAKVKRGCGFRGLLNYLLAPDKCSQILGGNMIGLTAKELSREFSHVRRLRLDCERPVLHIPLRMPKGEDVPSTKWLKIVQRFMEKMNLSTNRPFLVVKHPDEHIHFATSRIDYMGNIWLGQFEALRAIKATHELELEFNLTLTPTLDTCDKTNIRLTSGQRKKATREAEKGDVELPVKCLLAEFIPAAINESDGTLESFIEKLQAKDVTVQLNQAKTDYISGISFKYEGIAVKGSKIAREFSWKRIAELLNKRKSAYESDRITQIAQEQDSGGHPGKSTGQPTDERTNQSPSPSCSRNGRVVRENSQGNDRGILVDSRPKPTVGRDGHHHHRPAPDPVRPKQANHRIAAGDTGQQQHDPEPDTRTEIHQPSSVHPNIQDDELAPTHEPIEPHPPRVLSR